MVTIPTQSHLLTELERIRRKARNRLILHGCCTVAAGGVLAFLTIVFLDWLLWLPAPLRMLGGALFIVGFFGAIWYWVVRPLQSDITIPQVAGRVERHFGDFEDRLNSAVSFLQDHGLGSPEMMDKVVQRADTALRRVSVDQVLTVRPLAFQASLFLLGFGLLIVLSMTAGWWPAIGLNRYIYPLSEVRWPRTVEIDRALDSPMYVPVGESLVLNVNILKGNKDTLRTVAHLKNDAGDQTVRTMNKAGEGKYSLVVDSITSGLVVWFEAGDDSTEDRPIEVICVPRPEVREVGVVATPPAYATQQSSVAMDMSSGIIEPKMGGRLTFRIRANKPYGAGEDSLAGGALHFEDGRVLALTPFPQDASLMMAQWEVTGESQFQIELTDRHGFGNDSPRAYRIRPQADTPPTVSVLEPVPVIEVPPSATVHLKARASDDLGIDRLELVTRGGSDGGEQRVDLTSVKEPEAGSDRVEWLGSHEWNLAPLKLKPGDTITYAVEATDNFRGEVVNGQPGRSPAMHLRVLSPLEFDRRIREDLSLISERLRRTSLDQDQVAARTDSAIQKLAGDPKSASEAGELGTQQNKLARTATDLSRQLLQLQQRVAAAGSDLGTLTDLAEKLESWSSQLKRTASGSMVQAASLLRIASTTPAEESESSLRSAKPLQEQAARELKEILSAMGASGSAADVFGMVKALLDRQQQLLQKTRQVGKQTVGQSLDALPQDLRDKLRDLENEQSRLAEEATEMSAQAQEAMADDMKKDPEAAKGLEKSLRTLQSGAIQRHMKEASDAINKNRTAAATSSQKLAENSLREMLAGLEERRRKQLAELEKKLRGAEELVEKLLEQQQTLKNDTDQANAAGAADEAFFPLSERQRLLSRNSAQLSDELAQAPETVDASDFVKTASESMTSAEAQLYAAASAPQAIDSQESAIEALQRALELVRNQSQKNQQDMLRNSLNQLANDLKAIKENQVAVNEETDGLVKTVLEQGKLERIDTRRAAMLATREADIKQSAIDLQGRISEVPVYRFVMEQVVALMDQVRVALEQQKLDLAVQKDESEVVRQLDTLLAAIDQTLNLPKLDEFAEGSSGSGGNTPNEQQQRPVPPVAELIVLKSMQLDLNNRTSKHHALIDAEPANAEHQETLRRLGVEQRQLRDLTQKVTESARSAGGS